MVDPFGSKGCPPDANLQSAKLAAGWLLNSKIHNSNESRKETFGSFNDSYHLWSRKCRYAYTEITAYGVELFLDLYETTNDPSYLETAEAAGNWIIRMQYDGKDRKAYGSFPLGYKMPEGPILKRSYSFDAGICIGALVELYKKMGCERYLEAANRGAKWLLSLGEIGEGFSKPFYDRQTKSFGLSDEKWYLPYRLRIRKMWFEEAGCHYGKIAIGLFKLHSVTHDNDLEGLAVRLCEWTMSQQDEKSYFRVNPRSTSVFTHTHCYAIEGLLYAYEYLKDQRFLDSALKAISGLIEMQECHGVIYDWIHDGKTSGSVDSSSIAQMARIVLVMEELDEKGAIYDKTIGSLLRMQRIEGKDSDSLGGFYLLEKRINMLKLRLPRLYSWPTMFAVSALCLPYFEKRPTPLDLW